MDGRSSACRSASKDRPVQPIPGTKSADTRFRSSNTADAGGETMRRLHQKCLPERRTNEALQPLLSRCGRQFRRSQCDQIADPSTDSGLAPVAIVALVEALVAVAFVVAVWTATTTAFGLLLLLLLLDPLLLELRRVIIDLAPARLALGAAAS